jgi:superfamily II DNA/RNA helicase
VAQHQKTALLIKLLEQTSTRSILVFTRTKFRAKSLDKKLSNAGYRSTSLQGNLSQARRQTALNSFRSGASKILVATDIAARGIDISNVSHVINYDIPATPEIYIHRIGRTGRAEHSGEAFTLVTNEDTHIVNAINKAIGSSVQQRTLTDFNYDAPAMQQGKKVNPSANRSQLRRKKGTPKSKTHRRESNGAFAWLSPKKIKKPAGAKGHNL